MFSFLGLSHKYYINNTVQNVRLMFIEIHKVGKLFNFFLILMGLEVEIEPPSASVGQSQLCIQIALYSDGLTNYNVAQNVLLYNWLHSYV